MADAQLIPKMTPSQVVQGNRKEIEAQLQLVSEEETLTLIIPGKTLESNRTSQDSERQPHAGMTFREIFAPAQAGFDETGMTDDELAEFIEAEVKAHRAERNAEERLSDER